MPTTKKRSKSQQKMPKPSGWFTSDADEIERRRVRGTSESLRIRPRLHDTDFFGIYTVGSDNGHDYSVEIRSLVDQAGYEAV